MTIKNKLIYSFVTVVFLLMLAVSIVGYYLNYLNNIEKVEATAVESYEIFLKTKSLIRSYNETRNQQYIDEAYQKLTVVKQSLNDISDSEFNSLIEELVVKYGQYEKYLRDFNRNMEKEKSSLQSMVKLAHNAESKANELIGKGVSVSMLAYMDFLRTRLMVAKYVESCQNQDFNSALNFLEACRERTDVPETRVILPYLSDYKNSLNMVKETYIAKTNMFNATSKIEKEVEADMKHLAEKVAQTSNEVMDGIILRGIILIIFISVMAFLIIKFVVLRISDGLLQAVEFNEQLALGNLRLSVPEEFRRSKDELGRLANASHNMKEKFVEIVSEIQNSSNNVGLAVEQLNTTSQEVSSNSAQQAASLEEISSSMEEMTSTIDQNAGHTHLMANMGVELKGGISEVADKAKQAVSSSKEIDEKITIIQDIAFQTNILALNAAVEAARAGDAGRGFAVVAAEVRKLAERSKEAAENIVGFSQDNLKTSDEAGSSLADVLPKIEKTTSLISEIAASGEEQRSGVDQINSAVQELNSASQNNVSISEELAASSEELSEQVNNLNSVISYFKL